MNGEHACGEGMAFRKTITPQLNIPFKKELRNNGNFLYMVYAVVTLFSCLKMKHGLHSFKIVTIQQLNFPLLAYMRETASGTRTEFRQHNQNLFPQD